MAPVHPLRQPVGVSQVLAFKELTVVIAFFHLGSIDGRFWTVFAITLSST